MPLMNLLNPILDLHPEQTVELPKMEAHARTDQSRFLLYLELQDASAVPWDWGICWEKSTICACREVP